MPCDRVEAAKRREFLEALREVDQKIASGELKIVRSASGFSIVGWADTAAAKVGWTDSCLLRRIAATGSLKARIALRNAGLASPSQIRATTHSH